METHISGLDTGAVERMNPTENGGKLHGSYSWCRLTKRQTC